MLYPKRSALFPLIINYLYCTMKQFKHTRYYFLILFVVIVSFISCKQYIYDNMSACFRGVYINIYEQTECETEASYPSVPVVHVYAFDDNDLLVSVHKEIAPQLSKEYELFVPTPRPGVYSFITWAGIDENFYNLSSLTVGKTTKKDLLLSLKEQSAKAVALTNQRLYIGSTPIVHIGEQEKFFAHTKSNLREITNRIKVTVEGIENPKDYSIEMSTNNGSYSLLGNIIPNHPLAYPTTVYYPADSTLAANFTTLKLESGRNSTLVVRRLSDGEEAFKEELIGTILLSPSAENINLRCLNDFHIKLKMRKCNCPGGYMAAELWINDWLIHSYDIIFG